MNLKRSFFPSIIENSPDGHLVFEYGECVFYSISYYDVVERDPGTPLEPEATALKRLVHPNDRHEILEFFEEAVRNRKPVIKYSYRGLVGDGSYRWRQDSARLIYDDDGNHVKSFVVARNVEGRSESPVLDLRECRSLEAIREVHHRVKNDFDLARSILSLQADQEDVESAKTALLDAADRVTAIGRTYEILQHSSRIRRVATSELLAEVLPALERKAEVHGRRVVSRIENAVDITVPLARTISVVLNELVTNSLKYGQAPTGNGVVAVRLAGIPDAGTLSLTVRDDGPGHPENVLNGHGWGFGLEVVKSLAEQHGGRLNLSNDRGAVAEVLLSME